MNKIIAREIENQINTLLPHGAGPLTAPCLRHALEAIAQRAHGIGADNVLLSLMDIDAALVAVNQRLSADGRELISKRRLQAIARSRHDRFGAGMQVGGTGVWIFHPAEIDSLVPREYDRGV